ncbi:MAG: hypothetical protein AAGH89_06430 [Verrucomicrobiota bacterium]
MDSDSTDLAFVWIAKVEAGDAVAVSHLRGVSQVEAALDTNTLWLRGTAETDELPSELVRLSAQVFRLRPPDGLALGDSEIPVARLPELNWQPLHEVTQPKVTKPVLPGMISQSVRLKLVKSEEDDLEPNVLQVPLSSLVKWVGSAPELRFETLKFAAGYDGSALIWGTPIPSLPGNRFFEKDGVAVPLGQTWDPPIPAVVVAEAMLLAPGDLGVFRGEDWERVEASNFVPVSRAAVRLSAQNPQFGGTS